MPLCADAAEVHNEEFDQAVDPDLYSPLTVKRIALTMDQINEYDPPPNFAKETDSRFKQYVEQFGTEDSWELDALDPRTLTTLIREEVEELRDEELWQEAMAEQQEARDRLEQISDQWEDIIRFLESDDSPDDPTSAGE